MNSLINKIKALKLPDDSSGLKQNAVIDKVVEILNRYVCKPIYKRNGRAGNILSCDKCGCVIANNYVYCANCGRKIVVDNSEEIKKYPFKEGDVETRSKETK